MERTARPMVDRKRLLEAITKLTTIFPIIAFDLLKVD